MFIKPGVGFWVNAGIPKGPRSTVYLECPCCYQYHRADFEGDCRTNSERFNDPPDDATEVIPLDE